MQTSLLGYYLVKFSNITHNGLYGMTTYLVSVPKTGQIKGTILNRSQVFSSLDIKERNLNNVASAYLIF